jgi:hypothetical protein
VNLQGALAGPGAAEGRSRISAHRDPFRVGIWAVTLGFVAAAMLLRAGRVIAAVGQAQQEGRSAHSRAPTSGSRHF